MMAAPSPCAARHTCVGPVQLQIAAELSGRLQPVPTITLSGRSPLGQPAIRLHRPRREEHGGAPGRDVELIECLRRTSWVSRMTPKGRSVFLVPDAEAMRAWIEARFRPYEFHGWTRSPTPAGRLSATAGASDATDETDAMTALRRAVTGHAQAVLAASALIAGDAGDAREPEVGRVEIARGTLRAKFGGELTEADLHQHLGALLAAETRHAPARGPSLSMIDAAAAYLMLRVEHKKHVQIGRERDAAEMTNFAFLWDLAGFGRHLWSCDVDGGVWLDLEAICMSFEKAALRLEPAIALRAMVTHVLPRRRPAAETGTRDDPAIRLMASAARSCLALCGQSDTTANGRNAQ